MIGNMGSAVGSDAVAAGVAGPGAGGIVSRPRLFGRLGTSARVTVVSAPPGSGKTVLLRSWISRAGAAGSAAWVTVSRGERDPQQFWLSVLGSLRQMASGLVLVQPLTAAPDLDGWAIVERLLTDLAPLQDRIYLVIDDVQELDPAETQRQLELLVMRAPEELRFVLATRHNLRLGLYRLRLQGELAEIREPDLRFTVTEAEELFGAAGVKLPDPALLVERTEGWAAGLRLAALSLAGHPDPGRFAEEFSGTERTVAEYLLAEVLDRQSEPVRLLLLRTSVLERVNGELADLLTGDSGGERGLQDLEQANAFVVSLDARRSWFRYHHLFAELLQLELRCTGPLPAGSPSTGTRWTRSGTPRPPGTGARPLGCSRTTGTACSWTGRPPLPISCSPGFRPGFARQMPSWRRWPRRRNWRTGHWRRPSGTWAWRSAEWRRYRMLGAPRRTCCWGSPGWYWPASAGTWTRWPRRHGSCRPWPRPRMRRSLVWPRNCARWR